MVRVVVTFPRDAFRDETEYGRVFDQLLDIERPLPLIQFLTTDMGLEVVLELTEEKVQQLKTLLQDPRIKIKSRVTIQWDSDLCISCGGCVSLCNVGALHFERPADYVIYDENKCVQCGLCVDACPRCAITRT
ncbi:MAG TPA: 4Fe-4S binding protein [Candidatus Lokiarchaeia archaeon]|nr:4Fe-4S binding protein [Candidatus Lokiarchaeia archaeon]